LVYNGPINVGIVRDVHSLQKGFSKGGQTIGGYHELWVTHYHNDHTAGIPEFQKRFDCPCIADRRLAKVLTNPTAWRLPCLAPEPIRVDRPMEDGQARIDAVLTNHSPGPQTCACRAAEAARRRSHAVGRSRGGVKGGRSPAVFGVDSCRRTGGTLRGRRRRQVRQVGVAAIQRDDRGCCALNCGTLLKVIAPRFAARYDIIVVRIVQNWVPA